MEFNKIITGIFLITTIFLVFNAAYADDAPLLSVLQAEKIAQDYLDTHGYTSYKADIPGEYPNVEMLSKVTVRSTGAVKWIDAGEAKADSRELEADQKYKIIVYRAYVVDVLNSNGVKVGEIYVDGDDGAVVYTDLPDSGDNGGGDTDNNNTSNNNTTNDNQNGDWLQNLLDYLMGLLQQLWNFLIGA